MSLIVDALKLEKRGDRAGAAAAYRQALGDEPDSFDAHYGLARLLDLSGQYEEARQHFARATSLSIPARTQPRCRSWRARLGAAGASIS